VVNFVNTLFKKLNIGLWGRLGWVAAAGAVRHWRTLETTQVQTIPITFCTAVVPGDTHGKGRMQPQKYGM
jgi:hypothetical protein